MNARAVSLTIVAFLLGALAAGGIGVRVIREVSTAQDATSLPAGNIAPGPDGPYFTDPNETMIASVSLVPGSLEATDGTVTVGYDLTPLAPRGVWLPPAANVGIRDQGVVLVQPRTWVLEAAGQSIVGVGENVAARTVSFDVTREIPAEEVEAVRVIEAIALFPVEIPFTLGATSPTADLGFGVTAELVRVTEGSTATTVEIAVEGGDPTRVSLFVVGAGPGWRRAAPTQDGAGVTLTWVGGALPVDIPLLAEGSAWVPIEGLFEIEMEGLR